MQRQFGNAVTRAVGNVLIRPEVSYTSGPIPPNLQVVEIAEPKRTPAVAGTRGIGFLLNTSESSSGVASTTAKAIPGPQPEFAGNTFANNAAVNSGSVFIPPDSHAASGPGHIVSVSNTVIQFHTNATTPVQTLNSSLQSFFSALTPANATFDPKVVYDTYTNRWVVVTLELTATTSRIFVAASDDADPNGTWFATAINAVENIGGNNCWMDYPGLAVDEEAIYITGNMFRLSNNANCGQTRMWITNKTQLYAGTAPTVSVINPGIVSAFNLSTMPARPAGTLGANVGTFLTSFGLANGAGTDFMRVVRIDTPLGTPALNEQLISLGNIDAHLTAFPRAQQSGATKRLETGDRRSSDAVWRNNQLYAAQTVIPNVGDANAGHETVRWYRLNTATLAALTLADSGYVGGEDIGAGTPTMYPAVSVNDYGHMVVGFSASNASIFGSSYYVTRRASDAAGTTSASILMKAGLASYVRTFTSDSSGANRWGDYSGSDVDPNNQCFWLFNQHADTQGTPTIVGGGVTEIGRWATTGKRVCVCAGTESSGDFDLDGICTAQDNCPGVANNNQLDSDGDLIGDACDLCPADIRPCGPGIQVGSITLPATGTGANSATAVRFATPYLTVEPPVVIVQPSSEDSDPQTVRIRNVTGTGFELVQVEAPASIANCATCTGAGSSMTVHWLAATKGSYRLRVDTPIIALALGASNEEVRGTGMGALVKVGTIDTTQTIRSTASGFSGWPSAAFANTNFEVNDDTNLNFGVAPIVLSGVQTMNNEGSDLNTVATPAAITGASEPFLTAVASTINASGFQFALEASEVDDDDTAPTGVSVNERYGYIAIESGVSQRITQAGSATNIGLATGTGTVSSTCTDTNLNFPSGVSIVAANLRGFAGKQSRTETDGGWTRRCAMVAPGNPSVRMQSRIDEDADLDAERGHGNETIGVAIFGGDFVTSPVSLSKLESARIAGDIEVRFATATEIGHLGSRIWGRANANSDWYPLHPDLILSERPDSFIGAQYVRRVAAADISEIRIEDIDILGRSRFHPALPVGAGTGADVQLQPLNWPQIRAANSARQQRSTSVAAVRAEVRHAGIQRVTFSQIEAAGLAVANMHELALFDGATAIPRAIVCTNSTVNSCAVEWIGTPSSSLYGKSNYYSLSINAAAAQNVGSGALADFAGPTRSINETLELTADRIYSFSAPGVSPWFDERILANGAPAERTRSFSLPGHNSSTATIEVDVWGGVDLPETELQSGNDHSVQLWLNGTKIAEARFDGLTAYRLQATVPTAQLQTQNTLSIRVPLDTGYSLDLIALDSIRISYGRALELTNGPLADAFTTSSVSDSFFAGSFETRTGFSVSGISSDTSVWTQTLDGKVLRDSVSNNALLNSNVLRVQARTVQQIPNPALTPASPPKLSLAHTDYLIISHPQFSDDLSALVSLQQQRGLTTRIVTTDAIYAAGSDHQTDPEVIRAVIAEIDPRFVLLVGGDSYDYDNNLGLGAQSFVPGFYRAADPIVRFALTDTPFVDANSDGAPERAIGRLPVRTNAELSTAIQAIIQRANAPFNRYFIAAAKSGAGEHFDTNAHALQSHLRANQSVTYGLADEVGLTQARTQVRAALAGDADWVSYIGHSSPNRWGFDNILDTSQTNSIIRSGAPAIISQWGCWNSYFAMPEQNTMSHALMLRATAGGPGLAAAVLGSTSLAEDASHVALGTRFFDLLEDGYFGQGPSAATPPVVRTIGEALMSAKVNLAQSAPEHLESNYSITLFGDPAQPIGPQ